MVIYSVQNFLYTVNSEECWDEVVQHTGGPGFTAAVKHPAVSVSLSIVLWQYSLPPHPVLSSHRKPPSPPPPLFSMTPDSGGGGVSADLYQIHGLVTIEKTSEQYIYRECCMVVMTWTMPACG
jgi:hypothetical protein